MEEAGLSTISLSMIPELTASTGAPRVAAVERPFGLPLGLPGDASGQAAVLRGTLRALAAISEPGVTVDLGLEWNHDGKLKLEPPEHPPIVGYLRRHPWAVPRFINRKPPEPAA